MKNANPFLTEQDHKDIAEIVAKHGESWFREELARMATPPSPAEEPYSVGEAEDVAREIAERIGDEKCGVCAKYGSNYATLFNILLPAINRFTDAKVAEAESRIQSYEAERTAYLQTKKEILERERTATQRADGYEEALREVQEWSKTSEVGMPLRLIIKVAQALAAHGQAKG